MDLSSIVDPIFRIPFFVGLVLTVAIPPLGCYIRLRDEWLAALGLSQMAAAGALVGGLMGMPPLVGAFGVTGLAAVWKGRLARAGNDLYAFGISAGWAAVLLVAANVTHGDEITHGITDGQLYFATSGHLAGAAILLVVTTAILATASRPLLMARLMPERYTANQAPVWLLNALFDLLVAGAIAVTTTVIGVVGTFTLVFIPASLVFRVVSGWRRAIMFSVVIGVVSYVPAFTGAILLDQPFGPVLVVALLVAEGLVVAVYSLFAHRAITPSG